MSGEIVLGYDGSEGAEAALAAALPIAKALGANVLLGFGYEPPAFYAGAPSGQRDTIEAMGDKTLSAGVESAKKIDSSVSVSGELVAGRPAAALVALAERTHARMIVVGHHGGGTVRGAIMGSVTFKVLHDAPCPVLVVTSDD